MPDFQRPLWKSLIWTMCGNRAARPPPAAPLSRILFASASKLTVRCVRSQNTTLRARRSSSVDVDRHARGDQGFEAPVRARFASSRFSFEDSHLPTIAKL